MPALARRLTIRLARLALALSLVVPVWAAPAGQAEAKAGPTRAAKKAPKKAPKKAAKPAGKAKKKPVKGKGEAKKTKKVVKSKKARRAASGVIPDLKKDGKPNIQSQHGIVIDLDTDEVLWARQPDVVQQIASISKLLAAIVVVEKGLDLDATQTMNEADEKVGRGGARSRLLRGYVVANRDLLHAAMLGSDNRAVSAMGRSVGLNTTTFAAAMTEKAREMGLKNTRFGDPTGLDERNVSTPREIVEMLGYALKNETLSSVLATAEYTAKYTVGSGKKKRAGEVLYHSTNKLLKGSPYKVFGGKTGFTDEARYCLVVSARLDHERRVSMVFLHGEGELTRFGDFRRMAVYLKKNPPAGIAAPVSESEVEVTDVMGTVPFKDLEAHEGVDEDAPPSAAPSSAAPASVAPPSAAP